MAACQLKTRIGEGRSAIAADATIDVLRRNLPEVIAVTNKDIGRTVWPMLGETWCPVLALPTGTCDGKVISFGRRLMGLQSRRMKVWLYPSSRG